MISVGINGTHSLSQARMGGKPRDVTQISTTTGKEEMTKTIDIGDTG